MKELILLREYKAEATIGKIIDPDYQDGKLICRTLERPNNDNKPDNKRTPENDAGCIPEGTYDVIWSYSPHFKKETFEILNVPNRAGIRIHSANWVDELLGCIATATTIQDMNPKNSPKILANKKWMASQSKDALDNLIEAVGKSKKFKLKIIRA